MKLTFLKNLGLQAAAIGMQIALAKTGSLGGWQRDAAHIGIGAIQGAISAAAHKRNPDGSPADEPYTRPSRRRKPKEQ